MPSIRGARAERVAQNDRALRTAAAEIVVEAGWDAVTFSGVAKRAGLTVGAVYGRAESTAELAIDLWENMAGPWFQSAVEGVIEAGRAGNVAAMRAALTHWDEAVTISPLVVELLIASHFDPDMAEVIGADARRMLTVHMTPSPASPKMTRHEAAAGVLILSFAFGRAIAVRSGITLPPISTQQARVQAGMLGAEAHRRALPKRPPLVWVRPMDDLEPARRRALQGTLEVIGRVGYKRATIARIARAARVPRGSLLTHYGDKVHLVADAARHGLIPPGEVWAQYAPVVAEHGPLLARAIFLAEFLDPRNRHLWTTNLELARVSRFLPELQGFQPTPHVLENTHLGVMLTASLVPDIADLPYAGPFNAGSAT